MLFRSLADPFTSLYDLPDPLTGEPAPGFESICLQGTPAVVDTYKAALWIYLVFSLESTSASAVFLEGYLKRLRAKTGNLVGWDVVTVLDPQEFTPQIRSHRGLPMVPSFGSLQVFMDRMASLLRPAQNSLERRSSGLLAFVHLARSQSVPNQAEYPYALVKGGANDEARQDRISTLLEWYIHEIGRAHV